MAQQF